MNAPFSIWSNYYYDCSPEEMVLAFLQDGIHHSEFSSEHAEMLFKRGDDAFVIGKEFKKFLNENDFHMDQGHIDYTSPICENENAYEIFCRWVDLFVGMGIKNAVLHCDSMRNTDIPHEAKVQRNIQTLRKFAAYIQGKNICICLENLTPMPQTADELNYIIDEIGSPDFGICLDTGHLNLCNDKSQRDFILKAGKRLRALHIADNEGMRDQHMMPFGFGTVNFREVGLALKEIGYEGYFNYEIGGEAGARNVPLCLRHEKTKFIRATYDYIMNVE